MSTNRSSNSPRVLAIDDDPTVRDIVEDTLASDGCSVQTVDCAGAAQQYLKGEPFDVIVLDINMPGMDGCDLYRWMLAETPRQAAKAVFLTGGILDGPLESFLRETGRPLVRKPFRIGQLREMVRLVAGQ